MVRRAGLAALVILALALAGAKAWPAAHEDAAADEAAGLAAELRYIGRDGSTGMPERVSEQAIANIERDYERYGKDEREAQPPPPVAGADLTMLSISKLGVKAPVTRYGVDRFGRLDVPQDARTIGWQPAYSALPGAGGATFLAAHFEYRGVPGTFFGLSSLAPDDEVEVTLSDGMRARYRVTSTTDYPLSAIDMGAILKGREGVESLTLMTCSGPPNEGEYAFRTVVLAERLFD